jgi:hypothetical protein
MSMEKAPVHEYREAVFWQDNIGGAGQIVLVDSESVSHRKQESPNK